MYVVNRWPMRINMRLSTSSHGKLGEQSNKSETRLHMAVFELGEQSNKSETRLHMAVFELVEQSNKSETRLHMAVFELVEQSNKSETRFLSGQTNGTFHR
ncbi:unnamed protein product [Candidula unifasciata]|uniref:Uncharacterized protein n=1 Tax=Candidula unifasciata TaxID=100452 RepID=A0A8S3ZV46_9EUPU|nr:unnamed protein product [Candidula unifasciata]